MKYSYDKFGWPLAGSLLLGTLLGLIIKNMLIGLIVGVIGGISYIIYRRKKS